MKLIKITNIRHVKDYILDVAFDDSCVKQFDFQQLVKFEGIAEPLKNVEYFKTVKILNDGRSFGWENNYDCCADWARYFATDLNNEWNEFDESVPLKQRMKIAEKKMLQLYPETV